MTDSDRAANRRDLLRESLNAIDRLQAQLEASELARREPIAIVGLGCRYPGAPDPDAYWELLRDGRDAVREVPADRWDVDAFYDPNPQAEGKSTTRRGGFLDRVDEFDARFFGIAPREAATLDPQQRLLLEVAWETLEDAGIAPDRLTGTSTGVYVGITTSDYARVIELGSPGGSDVYAATGNALNAAAGRIAFVLGLQGPCMAIDTACSSSLVAVHEACQALRAGECDLALAGGVNVMLSPVASVLFSKWGMLANDGRCKAFDADADGFVRGEGCGMVALRRLSDAEANGDKILAVIRGSAVNSDGRSSGLTVPNGPAQQKVIRSALAMAKAMPSDVDYVEAHGTGTPLGDPIEVEAIAAVFGAHRSGNRPLMLGTVKANIGHTESASGIAGLLKVVLALRAEILPKQLHFNIPNPRIEWGTGNLRVVAEATAWPRSDRTRLAGVSSFGFSGTNAHVIVSEAPIAKHVHAAVERPVHLLMLSARTATALRRVATEVRDRLRTQNESFADVCFSLATGRARHAERMALVASDALSAVAELTRYLDGESSQVLTAHVEQGKVPRQAWLFTGQGSQWVGMGRELYETSPVFRSTLDECAAIVDAQRKHSLLSVMFGGEQLEAGLLDETQWTQPALFAFEYSLATTLRAWGLQPAAIAGHSLGEYVAACFAGVLSLEAALKLVCARADLMQQLPSGGAMVALPISEIRALQLPEVLNGKLSIAAVNGPENVVLSGPAAAVDAVVARAEQSGIVASRLIVSHAFHSALMEPVLAPFSAALATASFGEPTIPVVTNVSGRSGARGELATSSYWLRQLREPVRFGDAVNALASMCDTFIEIGPHPVLVAIGRDALDESTSRAWLPTVRRGKAAWPQLLNMLASVFVRGADIDFRAFDAPYARTRVPVPRNGFERERHWIEAAQRVVPVARRAQAGVHPLLGTRIASPLPGQQYSTEIDATTPSFIVDHVVFGTTLLPGTAFVEVGLAVARASGFRLPYVLEQLEIGAPLAIAAPVQLHVHVTQSANSTQSAVRITSAAITNDADVSWREHATLQLSREANVQASSVPTFDVAQARCATSINIETFHERLLRAGLSFGPTFRGLRELSVGANEAVGRIQLPPGAFDETHEWLLHPAQLDACFHVIGARLDAERASGEDDAVYLPIGIDRVTLLRPAPADLHCVATLRAADAASGMRIADLRIENMNGELVALIDGLHLRRVSAQSLRRAIGGDEMRQVVATVRWQPVTSQSRPRANPVGEIAIIPDTDGVAAALEVALTLRGARCVMLPTAAELSRDSRPLQAALRDAPAWLIDCSNTNSAGADWMNESRVRYARLLLVCQSLLDHPATGFAVITRGAVATSGDERPDLALAPLLGLTRTIAAEREGSPSLRLDLDRVEADSADAIVEAIMGSSETPEVALRNGQLLAPHLTEIESSTDDAASSTMRTLAIRERGVLDHLTIETAPRQKPREHEVEIEVRAAGLNFRDVLNALGMYPGDPGALGSECSGVVTAAGSDVSEFAVGDEVIAFAASSFATHAIAAAALTVKKPANVTFAEAASLPNAYVTAAFALRIAGKIQPGQHVLVHAAVGGVGLAAMRLAIAAGAQVIATAGSPEKRARALLEGATHAFDSRSISFADDVMRVTDGQGVDIVVNSLAGEFIAAGMRVVSAGGCFVELGKNGIWTANEAVERMPLVRYVVVDVGEEIQHNIAFVRGILTELVQEVAQGKLRPLPVESFALDDSVAAFRHMAMARHVGKIVIAPNTSTSSSQILISADHTYLITGGLSGLGLASAEWLAECGARSLVLLGRRTTTAESSDVFKRLRASGVHITTASVDVSSETAVQQLFTDVLRTLPPLRGIIHAAGITADASLAAQNIENYDSVSAAKISGTWNLHRASLNHPLDFFVLFSSSSALFGSSGQAPYAASNAFLDAFAVWRRAEGRVATSLGWGAWGESGMAMKVPESVRRRWAERGIGTLETEPALQAMGRSINGPAASVQIFVMNRSAVESNASPFVRALLGIKNVTPSDVPAGSANRRSRPVAAGLASTNILGRLRLASVDERQALLEAMISEQVNLVLSPDANYTPDTDLSLLDLGMDSLMAIELRNRINSHLRITVPVGELMSGPTIRRLSKTILLPLLLPSLNDATATDANTASESRDTADAVEWESGTL